jgi:hypothetical protein
MTARDEGASRERGEMVGYDVARRIARGEVTLSKEGSTETMPPQLALDALASDWAVVPEPLRDWIVQDADIERSDAEGAFWRGFASGVRAFIVELHTGAGDN